MNEPSFSASGYMQMRHLLTPKHLELAPIKRKQQMREKFLLETPAVTAQKNKMQYLKPLTEIQTLMRHFDARCRDADPATRLKRQHKRNSSSMAVIQHPSDKKMSELINLPSLQAIKRRAQSLRNALNAQQIHQKQQEKQKIMEQFETYLKVQLKTNPCRRRVHTSMT